MHASTQVRAPAAILLLGIVLGLAAAGSAEAPRALLLTSALVLAGAAFCLARAATAHRLWLLFFLGAATCAFWTYGQIRLPADPEARLLHLPARETTLALQVDRIFRENARYRSVSGIARVVGAPPESRLQPDTEIYFRCTLPEAPPFRIERGQTLQATGVLYPLPEPPAELDDEDRFHAYLKAIGVHYRFERSSALTILRPPSRFDRFCTRMNNRFQDYLRLGEPGNSELANVYVAMLLGRKVELSPDQKERYQMSGTMHFFAISGLHIGVIATVIAQFLLMIRVPRTIAPLIGLPLLYLYVEITGASPSAVRAFLMAAFFWATYAFQRQRSPFPALIASAVFVLILAPDNLWSVGFQLSYSVVFSILLFGLPLHQTLTERFALWRWLPETSWSLRQRLAAWSMDRVILLFTISFSAWLASSPLSAGTFGFISPGAILLNMLLIYFASLAIIGGVISLACALAGATLIAAFLNHAAWVVLAMMDAVAGWSLRFPGMVLSCENFPLTLTYTTLTLYFILLCWLQLDINKLRSHYVAWPPLAVFSGLSVGFVWTAFGGG